MELHNEIASDVNDRMLLSPFAEADPKQISPVLKRYDGSLLLNLSDSSPSPINSTTKDQHLGDQYYENPYSGVTNSTIPYCKDLITGDSFIENVSPCKNARFFSSSEHTQQLSKGLEDISAGKSSTESLIAAFSGVDSCNKSDVTYGLLVDFGEKISYTDSESAQQCDVSSKIQSESKNSKYAASQGLGDEISPNISEVFVETCDEIFTHFEESQKQGSDDTIPVDLKCDILQQVAAVDPLFLTSEHLGINIIDVKSHINEPSHNSQVEPDSFSKKVSSLDEERLVPQIKAKNSDTYDISFQTEKVEESFLNVDSYTDSREVPKNTLPTVSVSRNPSEERNSGEMLPNLSLNNEKVTTEFMDEDENFKLQSKKTSHHSSSEITSVPICSGTELLMKENENSYKNDDFYSEGNNVDPPHKDVFMKRNEISIDSSNRKMDNTNLSGTVASVIKKENSAINIDLNSKLIRATPPCKDLSVEENVNLKAENTETPSDNIPVKINGTLAENADFSNAKMDNTTSQGDVSVSMTEILPIELNTKLTNPDQLTKIVPAKQNSNSAHYVDLNALVHDSTHKDVTAKENEASADDVNLSGKKCATAFSDGMPMRDISVNTNENSAVHDTKVGSVTPCKEVFVNKNENSALTVNSLDQKTEDAVQLHNHFLLKQNGVSDDVNFNAMNSAFPSHDNILVEESETSNDVEPNALVCDATPSQEDVLVKNNESSAGIHLSQEINEEIASHEDIVVKENVNLDVGVGSTVTINNASLSYEDFSIKQNISASDFNFPNVELVNTILHEDAFVNKDDFPFVAADFLNAEINNTMPLHENAFVISKRNSAVNVDLNAGINNSTPSCKEVSLMLFSPATVDAGKNQAIEDQGSCFSACENKDNDHAAFETMTLISISETMLPNVVASDSGDFQLSFDQDNNEAKIPEFTGLENELFSIKDLDSSNSCNSDRKNDVFLFNDSENDINCNEKLVKSSAGTLLTHVSTIQENIQCHYDENLNYSSGIVARGNSAQLDKGCGILETSTLSEDKFAMYDKKDGNSKNVLCEVVPEFQLEIESTTKSSLLKCIATNDSSEPLTLSDKLTQHDKNRTEFFVDNIIPKHEKMLSEHSYDEILNANSLNQKDFLIALEKKIYDSVSSVKEEKSNLCKHKEELGEIYAEIVNQLDEVLICMHSIVEKKQKEISDSRNHQENIMKERNQAIEDFQNVEKAFSELLIRYEKSKTILEHMKENDELQKQLAENLSKEIIEKEEKYNLLQKRAEEKLTHANAELLKIREKEEVEKAALTARIRKAEIKAKSLSITLEQIENDNKELSHMCEEFSSKYRI